MNYFKILTFLEKGNKSLFDIPVEEQKTFLEKLGDAKNDIDRSKKQYLCQMYFVPNWKVYLFDFISIFLCPCYILFYLVNSLFTNNYLIKKVDCVCEEKYMPEILPEDFISQYEICFSPWHSGKLLVWSDVKFIAYCFFKTWSPYMIFKCAVKISDFSHIIHRYQPKAIQECGEYSFTSSLMTEYCHLYGVQHIDVMHGEKLYHIHDAYFHFDKTFVWHEHYKQLFISMKAETSQFVIAVPPSLYIDCKNHFDRNAYADYKYYLAIYNEDQIKSVVESMKFAKEQGKTVKYRIHPRYSDVNLLRKYVNESEIEYPKEVSILTSIASLDYAVGSYTTVLTQAYLSGKNVLLDDLTFKDQYEKVKKMDYFLTGINSKTLSELQ